MEQITSGFNARLFILLLVGLIHIPPIQAQEADTSRAQIWLGARCRPSGVTFSTSTSMEYFVQFTKLFKSVNPVVKFGSSTYNLFIEFNHDAVYTVSSTFIKPGFTFFYPSKNAQLYRFYTTLSAAFCKMDHNLVITVEDPNWGPSKFYYNASMSVVSGELDFGLSLKVVKRIHMVSGITLYLKSGMENPFPEIAGFEDISSYTPGLGYGYAAGMDCYIGLMVLLN